MKYFVLVCIALVIGAIVVGFFVVGSPQEERVRRFDERRIQDLQIIQSEIINYWQRKQTLPAALVDLQDTIRGFTPPTDPETNTAYGYEIRSMTDRRFAVCAMFKRASQNIPTPATKPAYYDQQNWEHVAGNACFERMIDSDFYPPHVRP